MAENFYDRVIQKFGAYSTQEAKVTEYPEEAPEEIFKQKIIELGGKDKSALDAGCGMGAFTLHMSVYFGQITGIDCSSESLKLAEQEQQGNSKVQFLEQDADKTLFADNSLDVVYSRRGPTAYQEFSRILKPGGHFVHIGIGEKDAWKLKQVFGRGQGYYTWRKSALELCTKRVQEKDFQIVYGREFFYDTYYTSYADLELFLQKVPIFQDFDREKDRAFLETYVSLYQTEKGIRLPRHRFVVVAQKVV